MTFRASSAVLELVREGGPIDTLAPHAVAIHKVAALA